MKPITNIPDKKNELAFKLLEYAINQHKQEKPYVIAITGAGGSGKTTFGKNIEKSFGKKNCISIDLDDYLISRDKRKKLDITGYEPKANKLDDARKNIESLINYQTIEKPIYDHKTGTIKEKEVVKPRSIIVIEGVTSLYKELESLNNISFFLDAKEETQIKSRIERDVKKRGYSYQEAIDLFKKTRPDYYKYIEPTKNKASIIFDVNIKYIMKLTYYNEELKQFINK